ncbi:hypothetical protein L842_4177 [Mycobacterium intracellulare MIN_052511_1280]|nr:hypothetical protein L842_4177 [Mycobacterium intracellulare MIN_052511_1280]
MAAIWQFEDNSTYELRGPAVDNTDLTAMPGKPTSPPHLLQ